MNQHSQRPADTSKKADMESPAAFLLENGEENSFVTA